MLAMRWTVVALWVTCFTQFEPSQVERKQVIPEKNHLTARKQNLACLTMWPEVGLNPERWDDEWFWALKISVLNHSHIGHLPSLL